MASLTQKTIKMVWGRSAGRCSMPDCREQLFLDETETDDPALLGEIAHIVGEKKDAARGESPLTLKKRNMFGNLMLLCGHHHDVIDQQPGDWPVERLQKIKAEHEAWIASSLSPEDKEALRQQERYADYLDEWSARAHIDHWVGWSSFLLSNGQPSWDDKVLVDIEALPKWILGRIWPGTLPSLENAFKNFARVANDLTNEFRRHAVLAGDDWWTRKFYQSDDWDENYDEKVAAFDRHVDLVQDLTLELTRAGNLICQRVRETLLANFRAKEGHLLVETGPTSQMQNVTSLVQYSAVESALVQPYPGLQQFKIDRAGRDVHFGRD